jgi:hypothetical protein
MKAFTKHPDLNRDMTPEEYNFYIESTKLAQVSNAAYDRFYAMNDEHNKIGKDTADYIMAYAAVTADKIQPELVNRLLAEGNRILSTITGYLKDHRPQLESPIPSEDAILRLFKAIKSPSSDVIDTKNTYVDSFKGLKQLKEGLKGNLDQLETFKNDLTTPVNDLKDIAEHFSSEKDSKSSMSQGPNLFAAKKPNTPAADDKAKSNNNDKGGCCNIM